MSEHVVRWTLQKAAAQLKLIQPLLYRRHVALGNYAFRLLPGPEAQPPVQPDVDTSSWTALNPPTLLAPWRTDFCLRTQFIVPSDWIADDGPYVIRWLLNRPNAPASPEALAYVDGMPVCGIDRFHFDIPLPASIADGASHQLALHGWTSFSEHTIEPLPEIQPAMLAQVDRCMRHFLALYRMALGTTRSLEENSPVRAGLLTALNTALRCLNLQEPFGDGFYSSLPDALAALESGITLAGPAHPGTVAAAGHAHIDVAWLWTLGQTRRKAAHTFHSVMQLMDEFPNFSFSQSQPQLYEFIREDDPDLFRAIKEQVQAGRWEPMGGMWVEADCNLSGAESLVRQLMLGRGYFRQHFGEGADSPVLWLPDVFGYCWSLPQLIREAGLKYFFTIKIGWNQYNRLPWDSFWWQGIDGTRVLTHCSPTPDLGGYGASTYNAEAEPVQILGSRTEFKQPELTSTPVLMSFGYGDGGGGPTREMLEHITLAADFPGLPHTQFSRVADFFSGLERSCPDRLPVWDGELYFEYHRGTYTTQSRLKRANRKSEVLLHDTEFLWSWINALYPDLDIPRDVIEQAWKLVCLNQFHDVLPGSSIGAVYTEALAQHDTVREMIEPLRDRALDILVEQNDTDILLVNTSPFPFHGVVPVAALPGDVILFDETGMQLLTQTSGAITWLQPATPIPAYGAQSLMLSHESGDCFFVPEDQLQASPALLENDCVRLEFNSDGDLVRIWDKQQQREVLAAGMHGNQLQAFEDRPLYWDAWDLDIFYEDKPLQINACGAPTVVECGPLTAALEVKHTLGSSTITQRIRLWRGSARIDFETTVDWHERHTLLKAAFPVDILAPAATYDIQWGSVQRPTHRNTSWDWARFETCAHKWVDLSEGGYGVSLLNDCKYGHDVRGNTLRLTLLRSSTSPDPDADQGMHCFTYALLPHTGGFEQTIQSGYALNYPLLVRVRNTSTDQITYSATPLPCIKVSHPGLVVETVKPAEDGCGIIVRMYESLRSRGTATMKTGFNLQAAFQTNLLEENQKPLPVYGQSIEIPFKPFQIITLRLIPQK